MGQVKTSGAFGRGRMSAARRTISEAVGNLDTAFTVQELADAVRRIDPHGGANATVYRAVAAMVAAGHLERVGSRSGAALYARCGSRTHHHHVVCEDCGRTAHTECPLRVQPPAGGFLITRHEMTLYGLCPECAAGRHA